MSAANAQEAFVKRNWSQSDRDIHVILSASPKTLVRVEQNQAGRFPCIDFLDAISTIAIHEIRRKNRIHGYGSGGHTRVHSHETLVFVQMSARESCLRGSVVCSAGDTALRK